jgi:membrane fusion protein (multidrug efflux system)
MTRLRPILYAAAVFILLACDHPESGGAASGESGAIEAGIITLQPETVPMTVSLPGRTVASAVAEIRPQVEGIIQRRVFAEGSQVQAGDLLYQINPKSYQATLDSADAALAKAKASVPSAQLLVDRYNMLLAAHGVSKQDLDEAKADVAAAQADVETARINLDYTHVTAPIAGLIGNSSVTQGALVTASQDTALATIRQTDPIYIDLTESSTNMLRIRQLIDSGRLQLSQRPHRARLQLENGSDYPHAGEISSFDNYVSQTTDTFTIRATFPNPDHLLLPGMYVRVTIDLGSDTNTFLLPQRAVSRNAKGQASALFVTADNTVETRVLDAERAYRNEHGTFWIAHEDIRAGDRLIVDGLQKVRNGQSVKPLPVTLDADGVVVTGGTGATPGR